MRLTFVISSLGMGGAQRALSIMARYWADQGNNVSVIVLDEEQEPFFETPQSVEYVFLALNGCSSGVLQAIGKNLNRITTIRKSLKALSPDVVISFQDVTNVLVCLAAIGSDFPVIVAERTDPSMHRVGMVWDTLRRWVYPVADRVVVQTHSVLEKMPHGTEGKSLAIPNPVLVPECSEKAEICRPSIIAVGRLAPEKGFKTLIRAFSRVAETYPDWHLVIVGEGDERAALEAVIAECRILEKVSLPGYARNVYPYYRSGDIFVLSSQYEGFPNALCEAMACGCPVIATDCPSGPSEIVRHGVDGMLVPVGDEAAMAEAMAELMGDDALREKMGKDAQSIVDRFGKSRIMEMWANVINDVVGRK